MKGNSLKILDLSQSIVIVLHACSAALIIAEDIKRKLKRKKKFLKVKKKLNYWRGGNYWRKSSMVEDREEREVRKKNCRY